MATRLGNGISVFVEVSKLPLFRATGIGDCRGPGARAYLSFRWPLRCYMFGQPCQGKGDLQCKLEVTLSGASQTERTPASDLHIPRKELPDELPITQSQTAQAGECRSEKGGWVVGGGWVWDSVESM